MQERTVMATESRNDRVGILQCKTPTNFMSVG